MTAVDLPTLATASQTDLQVGDRVLVRGGGRQRPAWIRCIHRRNNRAEYPVHAEASDGGLRRILSGRTTANDRSVLMSAEGGPRR
jgi:hypothetical protein